MYFAFDRDQEDFRASLRSLLESRDPIARAREVAAGGEFDRVTWDRLCSEMGIPGLHVSESNGGAGFTALETAIVFEELGRSLAPVPMLSAVVAIEAVLAIGSQEQVAEYVPGLASGERIGALAHTGGDPAESGITVAGGSLTGTLPAVIDGAVADLLVVPATDSSGELGWYLVETAGLGIEPQESLDLARPVASVHLDGTPAVRLAGDSSAIEHVVDVARMYLAFEMIGVAERSLEIAVDYAKTRKQFNRLIGSFQAIKHICAGMAVELDMARGPSMYAAMVLDDDAEVFRSVSVIAKTQAAEAAKLCAGGAIQVLGGIGFTWEHDIHFYYRRAKADELLFGSISEHRMLLADRVGI